MTRFVKVFAVCLVLVSLSSACNKQKTTVINNITSPTAPTPSPPTIKVDAVSVSTPALTVTLNACPATIAFTATVYGAGVTQTVTW